MVYSHAIIDSSVTSGTSTLETYYSNFIAVIRAKVPDIQEDSILATHIFVNN